MPLSASEFKKTGEAEFSERPLESLDPSRDRVFRRCGLTGAAPRLCAFRNCAARDADLREADLSVADL